MANKCGNQKSTNGKQKSNKCNKSCNQQSNKCNKNCNQQASQQSNQTYYNAFLAGYYAGVYNTSFGCGNCGLPTGYGCGGSGFGNGYGGGFNNNLFLPLLFL